MPGVVVCFIGLRPCLLARYMVELIVETLQTNSDSFYCKWRCGFVACEQGYQQLVASVNVKHISEAIGIHLIRKYVPLYCLCFFLQLQYLISVSVSALERYVTGLHYFTYRLYCFMLADMPCGPASVFYLVCH